MITDSTDLKRVDDFFDRFVFGLMKEDLDKARQQHANHLAALGLAVWTEVLGGLLTGKLRNGGESYNNFVAFLKYMGKDYSDCADQAYRKLRCGLVHEYLIDEQPDTKVYSEAWAICGIFEKKGKLHMHLPTYSRDLFESAERYRQQLKSGKDPIDLKNFNKAAWRVTPRT